jgi:2-octaprenyl-6-methoxyphenol hydroxylase
MPDSYDLVVVGGGLAGAALACALGGRGLRLALVEMGGLTPAAAAAPGEAAYDARAIALAYGSRRILEGIGIWEVLREQATPIRHVHVSDRGGFGFTRLHAASLGVEALGYVVEARALGAVLRSRLLSDPGTRVLAPARLVSFETWSGAAGVVVEGPEGTEQWSTRLVVGADGGDSGLRQWLAIPTERTDYGQTAVVTTVSPERPHRGWAYERFTRSGPMALLPLSEDRCALVWCADPEAADRLLSLSEEGFLDALQEVFGGRLGRFLRVGARHAYPLVMVRAREQVRERLVLLGNAAHALHPVAGQGFNLVLRDVAALAESISEALGQGQDPGEFSRLQRYDRSRRWDQRQVMAFTHGLTRIFSNDLGLLRLARNLGLVALDLLPPAKGQLVRHAMGLAGHAPRLARGLPLG